MARCQRPSDRSFPAFQFQIALACALRLIVFAPFERNTHRLISLDQRCLVVNTSGSIENWILTAA
jgi:hypothetical protein